jgi:rod shape-determining protein MreB
MRTLWRYRRRAEGGEGGDRVGGGPPGVHHRGATGCCHRDGPSRQRGPRVTKSSIRIAGDDIDDAISTYIQKEYKLAIGTQTAEQLKIELGSAFRLEEEESAEIRGRDLVTGLPKTIVITSEEIREAISVPVDAVLAAVRDTLDRTPPELASDIMDRGMILAGGGALLRHLDERLRRETGIPVHVADDALLCVAIGSGRSLEEINSYRSALSSA